MQTGHSRPDRLIAIDAIRGFCLINIFINHVGTGLLQNFSPSRVFFFDSADAFVFLAGISSFLAYAPRAGGSGTTSHPARRIWRRAMILYLANLTLALMSVALLLGFAMLAPNSGFAERPEAVIAEHGVWTYVRDLILMRQDVGYTVVLRVYVVLMLVAPLYVWLATIRFWWPLVPAGIVWVLAGHFGMTEYNSLTGVERSMTIFAWNLIFAAGISLGAAIRDGRQLWSNPWSLGLAAAITFALPIGTGLLARVSPDVLAWTEMRNDLFWTGASKSLQSPLRVANLIAAAYLVVAARRAPVVRLIHGAAPGNLFVVLGRKSLEVFVLGAVLALLVERVLWALDAGGIATAGSAASLGAELVLCAAAIWAMYALARSQRLAFKRIEQWAAKAAPPHPVAIAAKADNP